MTERHTVDSINSDQLDQLYADLDQARADIASCDAQQWPHRLARAEAALTRVTGLQEQWLAAGSPPLGVSVSRWWDARLVELHHAIRLAADESERTTPDNPPTSNDWTPPPPGDRREQLPDAILALIDIPPYTSTACEAASLLAWQMPKLKHRRAELGDHADRLHSRCRINNKFTGQPCSCLCHQQAAAADSSDSPASTMARWLLEGAHDLDVPAADAWTPDPPNGCLTAVAELDPFGYEERERTGRNAGLTVEAEDATPPTAT